MPLQATSGAASYDAFGGGVPVEPNYIESVFSTFLYTGNGSTQTINNGIDLAGEGGLVWTKGRNLTYSHGLTDTVTGAGKYLSTNLTIAQASLSTVLNAFTSSGYTIGNDSWYNANTDTYASWTFRKQPKFFDVVTWTGNGANRTIAHNLGSVPGCIIVKRTDTTADWQVYHRSLANTQYLVLNSTAAAATGATRWNSTTPTDTVFSLGTDATVNASGGTYVAYLYAHNAGGFGLSGTDNVISCGSFNPTSNGSVDLGYEPQWIIAKKATGTGGSWFMWDSMRGWPAGRDVSGQVLRANETNAEAATSGIAPTATGFDYAALGDTWIYIAIRRGPMKVPTTGTSVFAPLVRTGTASSTTVTGFGFPLDLVASLFRSSSQDVWFDRLRGPLRQLATTTTAAETTQSASINGFDLMDGYRVGIDNVTNMTNGNTTTSGYLNYGFRRAPGFFDEVCYTGNSLARSVNHNLTVEPELLIFKNRTSANSWYVWNNSLTSGFSLRLNTTAAQALDTAISGWNATTFSIIAGNWGAYNATGNNYVAYLFASCPGVSKVFSYTGNGSSQTINCGFTGGARFVMIKRTDSTGDWYVWDSARGIVSGNDPHLSLNTTAAEVTTDDSVDTDSTGFIVNQVAATNVNVNAATYIGLAIA